MCVVFFAALSLFDLFVYIRFSLPIIFFRLLQHNIRFCVYAVCLSTCCCCCCCYYWCHVRYLSIYFFRRLHCNKSFKSILCNFITYSAFVLHFTNIYYGNIYAIQKPKIKFVRDDVNCTNQCQHTHTCGVYI